MTEAKLSFTAKIDGDLFTVRGDTIPEFVNSLGLATQAIEHARTLQAHARGQQGNISTPSHDQAVATVTASLPVAAVVEYQQPQAAAPQVVNASGVQIETDKFFRKFHYGLPSPHTSPRGPMLLMEAKSKAGKPYKAWVDPSEGPRWPGPYNPADKADRIYEN